MAAWKAATRFAPLETARGHLIGTLGSPTLNEMRDASALMTVDVAELLARLVPEAPDVRAEYERERERIQRQAVDATGSYPENWGVEPATGYLLYTMVRALQPDTVVEIGVANGISTQIVLSAMDASSRGRLVSVDISHDVGGGAIGHPRWTLHVHHTGREGERELAALLSDLGPVDLVFHDASHRYEHQYSEYLAAWRSLRDGGVLVSDDVDLSFAFIDFSDSVETRPLCLVDTRKVTGIWPKAAAPVGR